jgi:hypothetical protein
VVTSANFAASAPELLESLGPYNLRGIADTQEIFALPMPIENRLERLRIYARVGRPFNYFILHNQRLCSGEILRIEEHILELERRAETPRRRTRWLRFVGAPVNRARR